MKYSDEFGFGIADGFLTNASVQALDSAFQSHDAGIRNALSLSLVRSLAANDAIANLLGPILGGTCFAVRAIIFNKAAGANWKVAWHQDCVIAVKARKDVPGWGPWSLKDGVHHVRPPACILERMLAVRLHIDDCGEDNGPLRVVPASHKDGILTDQQIMGWPKHNAQTLAVSSGDAILMRPLLLHSSSVAKVPRSRRVVHIEFAAGNLPFGLEWNEVVPQACVAR